MATTRRKSRREAMHDFGKPEHKHLHAVRARARKHREEEDRIRRIAAAVEAFHMVAPDEHATRH